ncbi:MAG: AIR synthase family protein [Planctomycetaceae bacterium]
MPEEKPFTYPAGKLPLEDLSRLLARYTREDPSIVVTPGIGRDATVISFGDKYLVAKTDPITFATDLIGWYGVNVNANDIAAMGGTPRWFLATLLLPEGKTGLKEVEEIFAQISGACEELGILLCGGHTEITYGLSRPILVGQMLGEVDKNKLVSPDKIRVGDEVILTKGIAIEGTALVAREWKSLRDQFEEEEIRQCRNLLRSPGISVVREARIASEAARIHAMHDPTEGGLATGLREMADAAGLGMLVEMDQIPILPETALLCRRLKLAPLGLLASGALLIAVGAKDSAKVIRALEDDGVRALVIAKVWEREKGVKLAIGGKITDLPSFARDEVARLFEGSGG